MWLLAIPLVIIGVLVLAVLAGLIALAIGGLIALIVGLVKLAPLLLVLLGVWLLLRDRRESRRRPAWSTPGGPAPGAPFSGGPAHHGPARGWQHGPSGSPTRPMRSVRHDAPAPGPSSPTPPYPFPAATPEPPRRRELPVDVLVKVEQIKRKADVLLSYADRFPPFSRDLYLVRQTTADYLPRTTAAYLGLPGTDDPVVSAGGQTALGELREQLHLLDAKLDDITQDLQRQDLDRLLANRQFLEERFRLREEPDAIDRIGPEGRLSPDDRAGRGTDIA